jgi:serine/threonine protein phosphatase 1
MPAHHRAFVEGLALSARFGDFFFCHAGIRPGVALDAQVKDDLIWIREGFLDCPADLGVVVVHGHTPTKDRRPDVRPNRIDIDTGAVFGGPLTCVAIEGSEVRFL